MSKGTKVIKVWALLYDTHMEDVPMIAVSDRCLREWRKQVKAGDRCGLIIRVAQEMRSSYPVAEHIIDKFMLERKAYVKGKT